MTNRNAQSRPHCVDLAPSAYRSESTRKDSHNRHQPAASRLGSNDQRPSAAAHAGAVRRSTESKKSGHNHLGKLTAAAVVVAGAVVWTTGSSEPLSPTAHVEVAKPVKTAVAPTFYFNDYADALERTHNQTTSKSYTSVSPINDSSAATTPSSTNSSAPDTLTSTEHPVPAAPNAAQDLNTTSLALANITSVDNFTDQTGQSDPIVSQEPLSEITALTEAKTNDEPLTRSITVASGDTLSGILNQNGLKVDQMHQLLSNDLVKEYLSNIDIGQQLTLTRAENGDFETLTLRVGNDTRINIDRTPSGFDVVAVDLPIESRRVVSSGRIDQSLYLAAEQANLKQSTIMELANVFQWELDFARDIRKGDQFSLVYDRLYREGKYIGDGDILAAEFIRGGKSYKAIRFTTSDGSNGYYAPDGQSMRRTFMRHPVDVVRITSKFNPNRLHPVLHQIRAHRGVDYGSPHGSPIYATADGTVSFSGSKNAYGNTVILKHGEKFSTLYAHMSRISDKSIHGKRVKQGDVIGYVGKTGRVTGTHLHYEFRVNGKQIDPLKLELPAAKPLDEKYRAELTRKADEMSILMTQAFDDYDGQVAGAAILLNSTSGN